MNRFLRAMFIILIIAMASAATLQILFPSLAGNYSDYGNSIGWQREIGLWNLATLPIIIAINLKYNWFFLKAILLALIIGGLGFGTNHLLGFVANPSKIINLIGALENYSLVICWLIGWWIERRHRKLNQ